MNIFLVNDDGYFSQGILSLAKALAKKHSVTVVAPHKPQSAAGHALTMHKPLRVKYFEALSREYGAEIYSCSGKPADCVILGIFEVLKERPDLVISGINFGANLGTDVIYSGTVSGALEAAMIGHHAIAASLNSFDPAFMDTAVRFLTDFVERYPVQAIGPEYALNINVPAVPYDDIQGIKVATQGVITYADIVTKRTDPFGMDYYWIGGTKAEIPKGNDDANLIEKGFVTVTPVSYMMTAKDQMKTVEDAIDSL